ncbi:hypothetical protein K432DRAFT_389739 [Lepidopterella palustris CBS 459.81]|uniref:Uncharacterized protein n=1 Tax=Lepidopterella palustris CBS 459.81 TaxID=1314670 RepID=A0A8E2JIW1_9PEZI|nr:hypothetical protein K432DRAFT_389739 [Lepidopterella palustris CBS 459.81]
MYRTEILRLQADDPGDTARRFFQPRNLNLKVVEVLSGMGVQYNRIGKKDSAYDCYRKVQDLIKRDDEMAIPAAKVINNCATKLIRQGNLEVALTILQGLLDESIRVLGLERRETTMVTGNIAYIYGH